MCLSFAHHLRGQFVSFNLPFRNILKLRIQFSYFDIELFICLYIFRWKYGSKIVVWNGAIPRSANYWPMADRDRRHFRRKTILIRIWVTRKLKEPLAIRHRSIIWNQHKNNQRHQPVNRLAPPVAPMKSVKFIFPFFSYTTTNNLISSFTLSIVVQPEAILFII